MNDRIMADLHNLLDAAVKMSKESPSFQMVPGAVTVRRDDRGNITVSYRVVTHFPNQ